MAIATSGPTGRSASSSPEGPARFVFSTDDLPERDRLAILREVIGRHVTRQEIDPVPDHPLCVRTKALQLPGLFAYWSRSSPTTLRRSREFLSDGNSNLLFQWSSCTRSAQHLGRDLVLGPGEAVLFSCADTRATTATEPEFDTIVLSVPRASLAASLRQLDASLAQPIPANSGPLGLLLGYLNLLYERAPIDAGLDELVTAHVCDLLAVTFGATRDAGEAAKMGGLRAARLEAIRKTIRAKLLDCTMSEAEVAAHHRVTPRYLQMLFEREGTTFTEFVCEERLARARRMLLSPRSCGRTIAEIAFECGFGDISYFNRKFRQRFGNTPRDVQKNRIDGRLEQ